MHHERRFLHKASAAGCKSREEALFLCKTLRIMFFVKIKVNEILSFIHVDFTLPYFNKHGSTASSITQRRLCMKKTQVLALGMVAALLLAGCSSKNTSSGGSEQKSGIPTDSSQAKQGTPSNSAPSAATKNSATGSAESTKTSAVSGVVTTVGTDAIIIAVNPNEMSSPAGNGAGKDAQGAAPNAASGQMPGGPPNQAPAQDQGGTSMDKSGPAQGDGSQTDISGWESATYKIDSQTQILTHAEGTDTVADLSAVTAGTTVRITLRSDDQTVADTITVMNVQTPSAPASSPAK